MGLKDSFIFDEPVNPDAGIAGFNSTQMRDTTANFAGLNAKIAPVVEATPQEQHIA